MPGVVRDGHFWYLDKDGDPDHEMDLGYGLNGDVFYAAGDWNRDGRETPGVVRKHANGGLQWLLDLDGDSDAEKTFFFGLDTFTPRAGDFNGDGFTDVAAIGLSPTPDPVVGLRTMQWHVSYGPFPDNGGFLPVSAVFTWGFEGDLMPVVGDWDGDGTDNMGSSPRGQATGSRRGICTHLSKPSSETSATLVIRLLWATGTATGTTIPAL